MNAPESVVANLLHLALREQRGEVPRGTTERAVVDLGVDQLRELVQLQLGMLLGALEQLTEGAMSIDQGIAALALIGARMRGEL